MALPARSLPTASRLAALAVGTGLSMAPVEAGPVWKEVTTPSPLATRVAEGGPQSRITATRLERLGYTVDVSVLKGGADRDRIIASLERQIDICAGITVEDSVHAFLRSIPLRLVTTLPDNGLQGRFLPGKGSQGQIELLAKIYPGDEAVMLHELMHAFHFHKIPNGFKNEDILTFYGRAQALKCYPDDIYFMSKPAEYFATTAAVFLSDPKRKPGHVRTRAYIREHQPLYYEWLEGIFGRR